MKAVNSTATLRELRVLVSTYLEGSDDAPRAAELFDALQTDGAATLRELRVLVSTYLEGSDDAPRAAELFDALQTSDSAAALRELRVLVSTYLEGSDAAPRAAELLDALQAIPQVGSSVDAETSHARQQREDRESAMFGCAVRRLDETLAGKSPRDLAMFAMSTLSYAQELIRREEHEGDIEWTVADRHANTLRQRINVAKYAIDKAVPR